MRYADPSFVQVKKAKNLEQAIVSPFSFETNTTLHTSNNHQSELEADYNSKR